MLSREKFLNAIERVRSLLGERCDSSESFSRQLIEDGKDATEASKKFLDRAEELYAFNELVGLVVQLTMDLEQIIDKEKNVSSAIDNIDVVEMPGANGRSSDKEDSN